MSGPRFWAVATFFVVITMLSFRLSAEQNNAEITRFDVVLVVDTTKDISSMGRRAADIVIDAMGDCHRLGIIACGERVEIIRSIDKIATAEDKAEVKRILTDIAFEDQNADLGEGLLAALELLKKKGRDGAGKFVLLPSGGSSASFPGNSKKKLQTEILPSYVAQDTVLYTVLLGEGDPSFMQMAAGITGGKSLVAPNVTSVTDAMETIVDRLQPPRRLVIPQPPKAPDGGVKASTKPVFSEDNLNSDVSLSQIEGPSTTLIVFLCVVVSAVLVLNLIVIVMIILRQSSDKKNVENEKVDKAGLLDSSGTNFGDLRELANQLRNVVVDAGDMIETLNLDLEDFGVDKWKKEKDLKKRYREFSGEMFLLLDHLEVKSIEKEDSEISDWLHDKITRIFENQGIQEITVETGMQFDGLYHKHVQEQVADLPVGVVLAVERKGYVRVSKAGEDKDEVLRQAEVVVSSGPSRSRKG